MRLPGRRSGPRPAAGARPASGRPPGDRPAGARPGRSGGAHPARGLRPTGRAWPSIRLPRPTRLPRFTPARAGALLGIIASLGAIYGLAATTAFTYARAEIPELRWTSPGAVEAAIGIPSGTNLFRITVAPIEDRIEALPGVARARVTVALPDTLVVEVTEREAIAVWAVGEGRFLVDVDGVLFAQSDDAATTAGSLPVIDDGRAEAATFAIGTRLDPVTLDAARRLGSLVPGDVGSVADTLLVTVSDATGFVVGTSPGSWIAIFGLYTPSARPPSIIPDQVRLLRSLLAGREETVAQVILADAENGTFIPKPTPAATP
ncbi:MAG TPA: FtsQ-type POTRA domain-containing protein [Candidatus Limnocylindrales bacterium]|nr:FtsQ-type POTRA domain-containing protein [Candidatus Limnocylindrales bacterium]